MKRLKLIMLLVSVMVLSACGGNKKSHEEISLDFNHLEGAWLMDTSTINGKSFNLADKITFLLVINAQDKVMILTDAGDVENRTSGNTEVNRNNQTIIDADGDAQYVITKLSSNELVLKVVDETIKLVAGSTVKAVDFHFNKISIDQAESIVYRLALQNVNFGSSSSYTPSTITSEPSATEDEEVEVKKPSSIINSLSEIEGNWINVAYMYNDKFYKSGDVITLNSDNQFRVKQLGTRMFTFSNGSKTEATFALSELENNKYEALKNIYDKVILEDNLVINNSNKYGDPLLIITKLNNDLLYSKIPGNTGIIGVYKKFSDERVKELGENQDEFNKEFNSIKSTDEE